MRAWHPELADRQFSLVVLGSLPGQVDTFNTTRHAGDDVVYSGAGDDVVNAGGGNDTVFGGADHDVLAGYSGDDRLFGEDGDDLLYGDLDAARSEPGSLIDWRTSLAIGRRGLPGSEHGHDLLSGGDGRDRLIGGSGSDLLFGGATISGLQDADGGDLLLSRAANDATFALQEAA
jgi:Ca2+-binding RTX toxin-like protein